MYNIKSNLIRHLGPVGGYSLCRYLSRKSPRILMYHRFSQNREKHKLSAATFRQQIELLLKHHNIIPLSELVAGIINRQSPPENTIVLTIDDGYADFYEVAFPILKQYQLPATIYITVDFVDGSEWLWPDKIGYMLDQYNGKDLSVELGTQTLQIHPQSDRDKLWTSLINYCTSVSDEQRLQLIAKLADMTAINLNIPAPDEYRPLSWEQLNELAGNGIEIGAHTRSHPLLSKLPESLLAREICECKSILEARVKQEISSFCYPNGQIADYSPRVKQTVQDCGYTNATVAFSDGSEVDDIFELRRHAVGENMFQFNKAISGTELLGLQLQRRRRKG